MLRVRRIVRPGLFLAAVALLPALAALLSGMVQVTRCVSVPSGIAHVGVNLALLRPAAECPTTGVALGGDSEQVVVAVVLLTAPMLLLHAGVLFGGWGAVAALRRSLARLASLVPWRRVPAPAILVVPARLRTAVVPLTRPARPMPGTVPLLRGPPAALPA